MIRDIYFTDEFGKLYEKIENGEFIIFNHKDGNGEIEHRFIKREIPDKPNYYDLITPYGYGGPLITYLTNSKENLVTNFEQAFQEYIKKNNIVSEFVRFHPLVKNHKDFTTIYETLGIRKTVKTKIEKDNTFSKQFSKSTKKSVRKLLRDGYDYQIIENPLTLDSFFEIYSDTMNRTNATEFYYFSKEYFENLRKKFLEHIILINVIKDGKIVSSGLYLHYEDVLHAHLSGTKEEYINNSPAYLIKYAAVEWAEKNDIRYLFHGGGKSSNPTDTLFTFKKKFAQNTEDDYFYIGKKIWNEEVYEELCSELPIDAKENYFPKYRQ